MRILLLLCLLGLQNYNYANTKHQIGLKDSTDVFKYIFKSQIIISNCQPQIHISGTETYTSYTYQAANRIDVDNNYRVAGNAGQNIRMKAGKTILIKPATVVLKGNNYLARIESCNSPCSNNFDYPKFFTPNGDMKNDIWYVSGIESDKFISLYIFDRFGKLLKDIKSPYNGWDGTYNNTAVLASDYWFKFIYLDCNGNHVEYRSHFSLLR